MLPNQKLRKVASEFSCEMCDYLCYNKFNYNKHLSTRKHIKNNQTNENVLNKIFTCGNCNNTYKHQSSLCKHKRTCNKPDDTPVAETPNTLPTVETPSPTETHILINLIKEIVKNNEETQRMQLETQRIQLESQRQNQELQKQVIELCKNGTHNTINNTVTNSNNKSFNLNFFLNEQCKNAINFNEFVNSIKVSQEDLMNTGQVGFVSGISKILIDQLNELGTYERPIHCTDLKRETLYIKENNEWNKEADDTKLRTAIQEVSRKSMGTLIDWKRTNPDYADMESKFSQDCLSMQRNSIAGCDRDTLYPRVVKELNRVIAIKELRDATVLRTS